ncbi:MAG: cytochrome c oxidase accessory protein FixG [Myxococcaceae bacterium]|nr:cytochrome c oxidase accessory protein FixG [Myxococcaceae bacterium]
MTQLSSVRADGSRVPIHPSDVRGRFITARRVGFAVLMAIYLAAPLVHVGGHPVVHLDVEQRRFYLFGGSFNAQDFWLVLFLATGFVFSLLFVTAWRGRVWCGWACPQTVFLEGLYRPIERLFDGPRERRMKLAGAPWTAGRVLRLAGKHATWLAISLAISHAALSLFTSAVDLEQMVIDGPAAHPVAFGWAVSVTALLHFNFTWFREQFCVVLCPYGRMQSLLHDRHSIVIGYDVGRGEPRGHLRKEAPAGPKLGDCIDCKLCVTACPTAIDIRDGMQMECIACAQCVDACDEVMDRIHKPRGLIRYASLSALEGKVGKVLRPRLVLYAMLAVAAFGALGFTVIQRRSFEANVLRLAGVPWVLEGTTVRNQFEVHVVNKASRPSRLSLTVTSPVPAEIRIAEPAVILQSFEDRRVQVVVTIERALLQKAIVLEVIATDHSSGDRRVQKVRFVAPSAR